MFLVIPQTLLGISLDLGYPKVWEALCEHFKACLPPASEVSQHLSSLEELSGDDFIDDFFVVRDYGVCCQRLLQRRLDYFKVNEALELLLLLNAGAV